MKKIVITSLFIFTCATVLSQSYESFYSTSQGTTRNAMFLLAGWSIANLSLGSYGWINYSGSQKYSSQMNTLWNVVNLGIASYSILSNTPGVYENMTHTEMLKEHMNMEKLLLINAGLDVLYIGGGLFMNYRSARSEKNKDLLKGYGQSVILQGGFLLAFDMIFYIILRQQRMDFFNHIQVHPNGISLNFTF